jgi:ankyrin repeat protein
MTHFKSSSKFSFYVKLFLYLYVFIGFSFTLSGAYEDFFQAIIQNNDKQVVQLLQRGFDPNTPNHELQPPLLLAIRENATKVVPVLLKSSLLKINATNASDETALMMAALDNHLEWVKQLVAKGADVNRPGWTPLHYAATKGHIEVMRFLLAEHAYIDAESPNGTTPLMMAAFYGTPAATKLLLEEGADPLIKNQRGMTALDFARNGPHSESVQYIQAFAQAALAKPQR